jgi:5-methylcytosine-specific restriction endonuclease McrA
MCRICGAETTTSPGPQKLEFDHAQPFSEGGDSTLANIQGLCRTCNRLKGAMTTEEFVDRLVGGFAGILKEE